MKTLITVLLVSIHFFCIAQDSFKYGKVSNEEMNMKDCSFYEGANAMVIGEIGELKFEWITDKGFQYALSVTVRKKIFTNEGKDEGNVKIRLYKPLKDPNAQSISGLKGTTYNLVNGKVEKTKLSSSDRFETRINDYWVEESFAMPAVQNGSIIEYKYVINSSYFSSLKTWYFQSDIPVAYSEFSYLIPEYFVYKSMVLGTVIPMEETPETINQTFLITSREEVSVGRTAKSTNEIDTRSSGKKLIAKNVRPLEDEPFMSNKIDVPSRIVFQLDYIQYPGRAIESVAGTFEEFNKSLMEDENFGLRLKNAFFAKDWVAAVEGKSSLEKAKSIYTKAKDHFIWNGIVDIFSDKAGRNAYTSEKGSVADINISLVAAFREAGLNAYPVILSTRNNGVPHPIYPRFNDYNYVVAVIEIDGDLHFADAASNMPFGKLPYKCLNAKGWLVDDVGKWVSLVDNNPYKTTRMIKTSLVDDELVSEYSIKEEDYAAYNTYEDVQKDKKEFVLDLKATFDEGDFGEVSFHEDNTNEEFKYEYSITRPVDDENLIYIQPFVDGVFLENPFKREERTANIDFVYQRNLKAVAIIQIPEGYTVELPEAVNMKLPNGVMEFKYQVVNNNNVLNVISRFKINQSTYQATDYLDLKAFFQMMAEKNNQMIVLKKS